MPATNSYDYAMIRVVPNVERGECLNVGVILYCRTRQFLGARLHLDTARLYALAPHLDSTAVKDELNALASICEGGPEAGELGQMSQSERFHWLVSPRSTVIQTSPVHVGQCDDPEKALEHLLKKLVM
jgi:hypothetical protein